MTNLRLVCRLIGLSSVLTALLALRSRATTSPDSQVGELGSQSALKWHGAASEERGESRCWPPPEGIYWGM
jgi:hypothetical protein